MLIFSESKVIVPFTINLEWDPLSLFMEDREVCLESLCVLCQIPSCAGLGWRGTIAGWYFFITLPSHPSSLIPIYSRINLSLIITLVINQNSNHCSKRRNRAAFWKAEGMSWGRISWLHYPRSITSFLLFLAPPLLGGDSCFSLHQSFSLHNLSPS